MKTQDIGNTMDRFSYVTLLSSEDFLPGVIMLDWSLKKVGSQHPLHVLCADHVSQESFDELLRRKISIQRLEEHVPVKGDINNGKGYDHWNRTFDKFFVWRLTQFDKVVYLDSDMQVVRNIDFLFDCPHMSAVRADVFNEPGLDKLNSGLMVIVPNEKEFQGLKELWESGVIQLKRVGDQDVIRAYYNDWGKKPELTLEPGLNVFYSEVTSGVIHRQDVEPVRVIHYIGHNKPWMVSPRAIYRRMKNNFMSIYLKQYALAMYVKMPKLLFNRKSC